MVIIISSPDDDHIPFVTKHLTGEYVCVDAKSILRRNGLTYHLSANGVGIYVAGKAIRNVTGIWLRRPSILADTPVPVAKSCQLYAKSALQECLNQLYASFPRAVWVSGKYAIDRAETKIYQLKAAQRVGFSVPETLITSSSALARAAVRQPRIVKTLARYLPEHTEDSYYMFYATKVTSEDDIRYDNIHLAPAIFQQPIEPKTEYRVTVIGNRVFPSAIELKGVKNPRIRDWHSGYTQGSIRFKRCRLPAGISQKCVQLVKELGLRYGAIDLIEDLQGQTWFIEINPNGQWAFVEYETGLPMGRALAALLEGRQLVKR